MAHRNTPKIPPYIKTPLLIGAIMLMAYLAFAAIIAVSRNDADHLSDQKIEASDQDDTD